MQVKTSGTNTTHFYSKGLSMILTFVIVYIGAQSTIFIYHLQNNTLTKSKTKLHSNKCFSYSFPNLISLFISNPIWSSFLFHFHSLTKGAYNCIKNIRFILPKQWKVLVGSNTYTNDSQAFQRSWHLEIFICGFIHDETWCMWKVIIASWIPPPSCDKYSATNSTFQRSSFVDMIVEWYCL